MFDDVCDANGIEELTSNFVNVIIEIMFDDVCDANRIKEFTSNLF
jgi:L-rhamnose isomerase